MKKQPAAYKPRPSPTKRRPTPIKKRVVTPKKRALLVHVRHTGRVLPRQHTSYPLLTFVVLLVGVLMAGCTVLTHADNSYTVSARVAGIPPSSPAIIDSPADGSHFAGKPITVSGTCPNLAAYVKLYRNGLFSGVAVCTSGLFTIQTDLFPGANALIAHVFNAGDSEGPVAPAVTVYYDPVVPSSPAAASSAGKPVTTPEPVSQAPPAVPLGVIGDFKYQAVPVGTSLVWRLTLTGGRSPYAVKVAWGDGKDSTLTSRASGNFVIQHSYTTPVSKLSAYTVIISIADASGDTTMLQLVALVVPLHGISPGIAGTTGGSSPTDQPQTGNGVLQLLANEAWPTYAVAILMLLCFWLGERRIISSRFTRSRPPSHRPRHA